MQENLGLFAGKLRLQALAFLGVGRGQGEAGRGDVWHGHARQSKVPAFRAKDERFDALIIATTPDVPEGRVARTLGVVTGEAIIGAHIFRDFFAGITNIIGGRAGGYEKALREARDIALQEMTLDAQALGADAVVGVDLDYETLGVENGMLMVTASGTAVKLDT